MTKFNDGEDIHIYQEKYVEAKATEGNPVHIVQDFESEAKADILDHEADKAEDRELAAKLEQLSDIPFAEDPSIPEMDEFQIRTIERTRQTTSSYSKLIKSL